MRISVQDAVRDVALLLRVRGCCDMVGGNDTDALCALAGDKLGDNPDCMLPACRSS